MREHFPVRESGECSSRLRRRPGILCDSFYSDVLSSRAIDESLYKTSPAIAARDCSNQIIPPGWPWAPFSPTTCYVYARRIQYRRFPKLSARACRTKATAVYGCRKKLLPNLSLSISIHTQGIGFIACGPGMNPYCQSY